MIQVVDETGAEVVVAGLNSSSPVRFTLPYTATNTSSTTTSTAATATTAIPVCAFYNRSSLSWSTDGCSTALYNATGTGSTRGSLAVLCSCSHLTEFTLLAAQPQSGVGIGGNGATLAASQALKQMDVLGTAFIYLIPLALACYLIVITFAVQRKQVFASAVPWVKTVYACIALAALVRCVCLALLYAATRDTSTSLASATAVTATISTFNQSSLAAATTSLLLLPLIAEVLLMALLGYRYAVVRRKEDASAMVDGKIDLRRASVFAGTASLMPVLGNQTQSLNKGLSQTLSQTLTANATVPIPSGHRQSIFWRLSMSKAPRKSVITIVDPPGATGPRAFAGVFSVAALGCFAGFLATLLLQTKSTSNSSGATTAVTALLVVTFLAALVVLAVWFVFLYYSVPNLKAVMRRGQALGWLAVVSFFVQCVLALSFCSQYAAGWYYAQYSAGGVHVALALYAIVECVSLCGMALWWRWTVQWWRTDQVKSIVSRYDAIEAKASARGTTSGAEGRVGNNGKDVWLGDDNGAFAASQTVDKLGASLDAKASSVERDRLDAKKLGTHRPSITDSLIFSVNEADDSGEDEEEEGEESDAENSGASWAKTQTVVTTMNGTKLSANKPAAEEKVSKQQALSLAKWNSHSPLSVALISVARHNRKGSITAWELPSTDGAPTALQPMSSAPVPDPVHAPVAAEPLPVQPLTALSIMSAASAATSTLGAALQASLQSPRPSLSIAGIRAMIRQRSASSATVASSPPVATGSPDRAIDSPARGDAAPSLRPSNHLPPISLSRARQVSERCLLPPTDAEASSAATVRRARHHHCQPLTQPTRTVAAQRWR